MATERISGERAKSAVTGLIRHVPALVLGIATTACAHSATGMPTSPPKESAPMSATDTPKPHTLAEYPELTPEEMGRRFLKLIDSLKSFDELTPERIQEILRLRMTPTPEISSSFFNMHLPDSGWYYNVVYYDNSLLSERKSVSYNFINRPTGQDDNDRFADMTPVCGMDFNAYVAELKKMGFVEREDLAQYDSPMPPAIYDPKSGREVGYEERKFFRLPGYSFSRGDVGVLIRERSEEVYTYERYKAGPPDTKLNHFCVESISVGKGA